MFCERCDNIIETEDMFEIACNCHHEIEAMSDADFREVYDSLPTHLRDYFTPPEPKPKPFSIIRFRRKLKDALPTSARYQGWGLRFISGTYEPLYQKRFGAWVRMKPRT